MKTMQLIDKVNIIKFIAVYVFRNYSECNKS